MICSNVAVMGVHAAFPSDSYTLGTVIGDGVALRKESSVSSTRLELMYKGESVHIDIHYNNLGGWSHVRRVSTGTVGYSYSQYIEEDM